ncbi:MAG: TonB-dependent receptor [Chromatiales bacterium]|nr:MAG: TonB-dependent receptor [Chromatiales bacterium]
MNATHIACVLALAAAASTPAIYAQGNDQNVDEPIEEIVVTGSRLVRRDFNAPSPIATLDSEFLAASGQATLEESLNQMPQIQPDFGRSSNNPGDGTARINLRDLGAGRSLVMLNGRRLAPSGVGGAVDVNNIPKALIDRVEIITGGATTVYGSDAIAGVANFITRDDFDGFGIDTSAYVTEVGDSNTYDINVTYGLNFDKGNLTLYAGYYDREETFAGEREFTSVVLTDTWEGTVVESGSSTIPAGMVFAPRIDFGNGPVRVMFDANGDPVPYDPSTDFYNYAPVNYLQIPLRRVSGGAMFHYDLSSSIEIYAELQLAKNSATQTLAPVPAAGFFEINTDNPVLTAATRQLFIDNLFPAGPGLVSMGFSRRMLDLGPRTIKNEREYSRVVTGLRGEITDTWDFDVWATYTKGDETEFFLNDASSSRMQQGLLVDPLTGQCFDPSGGCVPLNLFGEGNLSAEGLAFLRFDPFTNLTSRTQKLLSAFVRGAPFDSWAGPINVAVGVEWRSDSGDFQADEALFSDDTLGFFPRASVNGSESVKEIYAEASIPLFEGASFAEYIGIEFGGRYSDYEHAGGVDTWKFGGEWALPVPVRFRAMFQRSVRAPDIAEAFTEQGLRQGSFVGSTNSSNDPCSASNDPVASGIGSGCVASGIPESQLGIYEAGLGVPTDYIFGGNPSLIPETAETFTAGIVLDFDWLQGVQVSLDYFDLQVEDTIGGLDAALACYDAANTGNVFCENITRDPVTYDVIRLYEPNINRGSLEVEGTDTQISLESDLPSGMAVFDGSAGLSVDLVWTHMLKNTYQETVFGTVIDCAGTFAWPCQENRDTSTYPTDRIMLGATYHSGDFDIRLSVRWIDEVENGLARNGFVYGLTDLDLGNPTGDAKTYTDLGIGYRFSDNISARLTIANLTETSPALVTEVWSGNTDPTIYDVFGRSYSLGVSMEF